MPPVDKVPGWDVVVPGPYPPPSPSPSPATGGTAKTIVSVLSLTGIIGVGVAVVLFAASQFGGGGGNGGFTPNPNVSEVRSASRAMASEYLVTLAARIEEAIPKNNPRLASEEMQKAWAEDRAKTFNHWLGEYSRSIVPETGEPTEAEKQTYNAFLADMASGIRDAAQVVDGKIARRLPAKAR